MNQNIVIKHMVLAISLLSVGVSASAAGWRNWLSSARSGVPQPDVVGVVVQQGQAEAQQEVAPVAAGPAEEQASEGRWEWMSNLGSPFKTVGNAVAGSVSTIAKKAYSYVSENAKAKVKSAVTVALGEAYDVSKTYIASLAACGTALAVNWKYSDFYNTYKAAENTTPAEQMINHYKVRAINAYNDSVGNTLTWGSNQLLSLAKSGAMTVKNNPGKTLAVVAGWAAITGGAYASYRWYRGRGNRAVGALPEPAASGNAQLDQSGVVEPVVQLATQEQLVNVAKAVARAVYNIREVFSKKLSRGREVAREDRLGEIVYAVNAARIVVGSDMATRVEQILHGLMAEEGAFYARTRGLPNFRGSKSIKSIATSSDVSTAEQIAFIKGLFDCLNADDDTRAAVIESLTLSEDNKAILKAILSIA